MSWLHNFNTGIIIESHKSGTTELYSVTMKPNTTINGSFKKRYKNNLYMNNMIQFSRPIMNLKFAAQGNTIIGIWRVIIVLFFLNTYTNKNGKMYSKILGIIYTKTINLYFQKRYICKTVFIKITSPIQSDFLNIYINKQINGGKFWFSESIHLQKKLFMPTFTFVCL